MNVEGSGVALVRLRGTLAPPDCAPRSRNQNTHCIFIRNPKRAGFSLSHRFRVRALAAFIFFSAIFVKTLPPPGPPPPSPPLPPPPPSVDENRDGQWVTARRQILRIARKWRACPLQDGKWRGEGEGVLLACGRSARCADQCIILARAL